MLDGPRLRDTLGLLVNGLVGLRDEGRFDEPNLDGTRGDYISFESWEWPQGVGLYGLVRLRPLDVGAVAQVGRRLGQDACSPAPAACDASAVRNRRARKA